MEIGSIYEWTSQAMGSTATKKGVVMAIVPARTSVFGILKELGIPKSRARAIDKDCSQRDRLLVEVPRTGVNGQPLVSKFYAPIAPKNKNS